MVRSALRTAMDSCLGKLNLLITISLLGISHYSIWAYLDMKSCCLSQSRLAYWAIVPFKPLYTRIAICSIYCRWQELHPIWSRLPHEDLSLLPLVFPSVSWLGCQLSSDLAPIQYSSSDMYWCGERASSFSIWWNWLGLPSHPSGRLWKLPLEVSKKRVAQMIALLLNVNFISCFFL